MPSSLARRVLALSLFAVFALADTVTFGWTINVNSSVGATESYNKLTFVETLPAPLRWDTANVPLLQGLRLGSMSGKAMLTTVASRSTMNGRFTMMAIAMATPAVRC
ncbi:hypothetical protein DSM104299_01772 [Baekduia alba]|uniref:hypothetical protein n=1 Tax=Baekduia alba TaxID=2997333 RepID=UPI0023409E7E|nr:hypothetical protein [Baekduia alba]WCB93070.1 hypothetical protein DSM104299_01772 [Baekduia alba]